MLICNELHPDCDVRHVRDDAPDTFSESLARAIETLLRACIPDRVPAVVVDEWMGGDYLEVTLSGAKRAYVVSDVNGPFVVSTLCVHRFAAHELPEHELQDGRTARVLDVTESHLTCVDSVRSIAFWIASVILPDFE
jgi:hypothetical protein